MATDDVEVELSTVGSGAQPSRARRRGDVVVRRGGPWSPAVLALLRHYEAVGFDGAPRVVEPGLTAQGEELVTFLPGSSPHPAAWPDEALPALGDLLRRAHDAGTGFALPDGARWRRWFGRHLIAAPFGGRAVIGHCDTGPWNVVADQEGRPYVLVDWEFAGPVPASVELAHTAWLNAQLHDDDVAEALGLPPAAARAAQVGLLLDGYGLPVAQRREFVDALVEVAVRSARAEAVDGAVTPESTRAVTATGYPLLWAVTWRTRSATWILDHRSLLERALR